VSWIGRRAALAALRLYPVSWRARYRDELIDLIDSTDSSLRDAADLAESAVAEHMRGGAPMRFEAAQRHSVVFAMAAALLLLPTLVVVTLSLVGHELGVASVARAIDPVLVWVGTVGPVDLGLVLAPAAAFVVAVLPLLDVRVERVDGDAAVAIRLRPAWANVTIALLALLVGVMLIGHILTESALQAAG
jgi:hypothetical protein